MSLAFRRVRFCLFPLAPSGKHFEDYQQRLHLSSFNFLQIHSLLSDFRSHTCSPISFSSLRVRHELTSPLPSALLPISSRNKTTDSVSAKSRSDPAVVKEASRSEFNSTTVDASTKGRSLGSRIFREDVEPRINRRSIIYQDFS